MIAPFLPLKFENKGVSKVMIGVIFAVYPLAGMVGSPIAGILMDKTGPKAFMTSGLIVLGLCLICFGLLDQVDNPDMISVLAILLRTVEGFAASFVATSAYSIATNDFPNETDEIVGYLEASYGVGLLIGPVVGAFIYAATNF